MNNKVHTATKVLPFIANYGRELRMGGDIRKRRKVEKATEFVERIKKIHEEAEAALKKAQKDIKRQVDRGKKETKDWKKKDRVLLILRSMPPGVNMDKGKGYDDNDRLRHSSLSQRLMW